MLRKRVASNGLLPGRDRFAMMGRRTLRQAGGCAVVFAALFAAGPAGVSAPAAAVSGEARLDFMSTDDGLTRESIAAISRPEAVRGGGAPAKNTANAPKGTAPTANSPKSAANPAPTASPAATVSTAKPASTAKSTASTRRRTRLLATTSARHHRHWRHRRYARHHEEATPPPSTPQVRPRRNFVVKFVTWWNGMVIRNFHTRFGTVKLDSWGADT